LLTTSGGTSTQNNSTGTISVNQWSHVALVVESGVTNGTKLYINGSSETLGTHTITTNNSAPFQLGKRYDSFYTFGGLMDEVAIFNSALTDSQITNIYKGEENGGSGGTNGVPGDLSTFSPLGWWRMGDGSGDTDSGGGTPANTDTIGTVVNQGSASNANGTGTNGPTFSTDVPS